MTAHIITVTDEKKFKGDWANALAVGQALKSEMPDTDVIEVNLDGEDALSIDHYLLDMKSDDPVYIVTAGEARAYFLANIEATHITKILSSHQLSDEIRSVAKHFNFVALPQHAITEEDRYDFQDNEVALIETVGVPHLVTKETLKEAYCQRKETDQKLARMMADQGRFDQHSHFDLLVLGGDAPDANGNIKHFLPDEAAHIALKAMQEAEDNDDYLMIVNGPRTGKYDPETGAETSAHRGDTALDPVTAAARDALVKMGYAEGFNFHIWDFRFLDKGVDSAYQALLYVAEWSGGKVYMPGESTSMVTESVDVLKRPIVIYESGSMNAAHLHHMEAVYQAGQASLIWKNGNSDPVKAVQAAEGYEFMTDAQQIARAVLAAPRP